MKHFVSAFAFLAVICCLTSAAPRPQPVVDSLLGLIGGGGGGLGGLPLSALGILGGAGGGSPLEALAILNKIGGLRAPTGPSNVQSSGGSTTVKGAGNSVNELVKLDGNANVQLLNNVLSGGY